MTVELASLARALGAHASAVSLAVVGREHPAVIIHAGRTSDTPTGRAVVSETLYDLASLTKVFTALAVLRLVELGQLSLDDPLGTYVADTPAADATIRQALSHTTGLPATADLYRHSDPKTALRAVIPIARPGARVIYSDLGFVCLGQVLACRTGQLLEATIDDLISSRLGIGAHFGPARNVAATTGWCGWRRRTLSGEVHDENAAALAGVAGHAGLFGTLPDMTALASALLGDGGGVVAPATIAEMTREQVVDGPMRRGLGFSLWSPDPYAASHPFDPSAFGHSGFTGTSIWIDPRRGLGVALLTNAVARARDTAGFQASRVELHRQIVALADARALFCEGDR